MPRDILHKKQVILIVPAMAHPAIRVLLRLFRPSPISFSLLSLIALVPKEYQIKVICDKLWWSDRDFIGGALVGISCLTSNAKPGYALADRFRQAGSTVVIGGPHASVLPEEALKHCDAVVIGEAESVWPQVIRDYASGALQKIYRGVPLDDFFSPCADYFLNNVDPGTLLKAGFMLSRGCKYHCEFCSRPAGGLRFIPLERIMPIIEKAVRGATRPFGVKPTLLFRDDNIFSSPAYAKEFFKRLMPLQVRWIGNSSLDIAFDQEALELAKASGCAILLIGFETAHPDQQVKTCVGGIKTMEDFRPAIRRINSFGIKIMGSFIVGWDDHTPADYLKLMWFFFRSNLYVVALSILTPYPGSRLYDRLEREGRILTRDWDKYDLLHHVVYQPKNMSVRSLRLWYVFIKFVGAIASYAGWFGIVQVTSVFIGTYLLFYWIIAILLRALNP